jgi:hypothetical protein
MPTLWQKTTTLCIFENKGALYEQFPENSLQHTKRLDFLQ